MWWKILLLGVYLILMFVLSRILEAVAYYEGSYIASRLLDPVSVSVRKLKAILDRRGVSYAGVVDKQDLNDIVESSGEVAEGELQAATLALAEEEEDDIRSTTFSCGTHFYEEVEDTKDSVWVVHVIHEHHPPFMQYKDWKAFIKKVSRFGVRTGIFNCSRDHRLCDRKQWYTSQLILSMPQGYRAKDHVVLRSYAGSSQPQAIFDWVNFNLASRVREIYDDTTFRNDWLEFNNSTKRNVKIRVILFSTLKSPPMFFSALSVKFTGRVKFGVVHVDKTEGQIIQSQLNLTKVPAFIIKTPETVHRYGDGPGEYFNFESMSLYLKTLHPEVNDMFLLSIILVNMACWLEFFVRKRLVFQRLASLAWTVVKWNFLLILLWLPGLALFQLHSMDKLLNHILVALRFASTTRLAGMIRRDWLSPPLSFPYLVLTFLLYAVAILLLYHFFGKQEEIESRNMDRLGFWNFRLDSSVFFSATSARQRTLSGDALETGMELLIERLAVPNFWLRPIVPLHYIHELPVWKYTGPTVDSDIGSDTDCPSPPKVESDCEDSGTGTEANTREFGPRPLMFVCERCRALQNRSDRKSEQELEAERIESESACAKYVMDGNYKCMCGQQGTGHGHPENGTRNPRKENQKGPSRSKSCASDKGILESEYSQQMPPGIIETFDCSICLESYKYGVMLCGLPCGHAFHQHCIMGWLHRDNHCCPICRWATYKAKPCNAHQHID